MLGLGIKDIGKIEPRTEVEIGRKCGNTRN